MDETSKKKKKKLEAEDETKEDGRSGTKSKRRDAEEEKRPSTSKKAVNVEPSDDSFEDAEGSTMFEDHSKKQEVKPATLTGFTEMPVKDFFLITLLWLPRFFVPWIAAWHEFNVFILANPHDWDRKEMAFQLFDLIIFGAGCVVSIMVAVIADLVNLRYYVYMVLLLLYASCPIAGGFVDVVLRSRMFDKNLYNYWFLSIILMRATMVISFVFFPVQFACIYSEKDNMSRQAHYNWTAFFAFFEFTNAYIAFWVIPGKCPTKEWTQIGVWVGITGLLYLLILLTLTFSLIVKRLRYTLMTCLKICGLHPEKYLGDEYNEKGLIDSIPKDTKKKKLMWFGLMLIPIVFTSFVYATLERFVPDEDWDKHNVLSATSMFFFGRMLGVVVMVVVLYWVRHGFKTLLRLPIFRADVLVLGLPHLFNVLALLVLLGRYATLSRLSPGDTIIGPIQDETKSVIVFFNLIFRNRTVCVKSNDFRPVKIRPLHHATRELYDYGLDSVEFAVIPEPGATPIVATGFTLHNLKMNSLYVFTVSLYKYLNKDAKENITSYKEFMTLPRIIQHVDTSSMRPEGVPQVIIVNTFIDVNPAENPISYLFKQGSPSANRDDAHVSLRATFAGSPLLWKAPAIGKWFLQVFVDGIGILDVPPFELEIRNFTLYVLAHYLTSPVSPDSEGLRNESYTFKLFTIGEIAGPESNQLPTKRVLQRDWAIQLGLSLAGMSAGGVFVGIVYLFWMDPPFPGFQTTALAVFWVLMVGAAESPKIKLVDVGLIVSSVLLVVQILCTALHVFASMNLYTAEFNFRKRPD